MIRTKETNNLGCIILIGALFIASLIIGAEALAADQNPCSEDISKFCKDIDPGKRAMMECLEQHESQLSDACKDYEAKMESPRAESREAIRQQMMVRLTCRDDVAKFCSDIKPGSAGTTTCLREHSSQLSMPCKDALEQAKEGEEEKTNK